MEFLRGRKLEKIPLVLLIIFASDFLGKSDSWRLGDRKVWLPDLEFTTKNNWVNGKVPTKHSRIKFPMSLHHSVGLIGGLVFAGVELPLDGSLLLARNGVLQLTESTPKDSKDKPAEIFEWKWKGAFSWMDPENWSGSNRAVPHLEKIPCGTDMVILPPNNRSLSIELPNVDVNIKEIKIGDGVPLESWDWQEIMNGREFTNNHGSVKYSGVPYCDTNKCLCRHGSNVDDLMKEICEIEGPRCRKQGMTCSYPIEVEGHCCPFCGGRLSLNIDAAIFPLSKLREITTEALAHYSGISHHVRVTLNENVEVLVAENGIYTGLKSVEVVDTLQKLFSEKGINVMSTTDTGPALKGSAVATALVPMFGVPLVIIILILLAIPYFGYSYREVYVIFRTSMREGNLAASDTGKAGDFGFARFENVPEGEVQLASAMIPEEMDSDDEYGDGKRFENPLYRSKRKEPVEKIIDITAPVSLTQLERKVNLHEETNLDSE